MNKIYNYLLILIAVSVLGLYSCKDEVHYDPAALVTGQGLYFSPNTVTSYVTNEATGSLTLDILRTNTANAASADVNVVITDGESLFTYPSTVSFAADQASATYTIDYSNLVENTVYTLNISFPEGTPYAVSSEKITVTYQLPNLENWQVVSTQAVYVDNLFSMYGATNVKMPNEYLPSSIVVEKLEGKDMYRFKSPYNSTYFAEIFGIENFFPAAYEYPYIILDGETYKDLGLWYIAPTSLGFQMVNGTGPKLDPEWETFGSVACNLSTADGPIPPTSTKYPLGTYNTKIKQFDFGTCYHNLGNYGFYVIDAKFTLSLDPKLLKIDYENDYTWAPKPLINNTFTSSLMGASWTEPILIAEEDENLCCLPLLYADNNFYFKVNWVKGNITTPKELEYQPMGMFEDELEDLHIKIDESTSAYDPATGIFKFSLDFYAKEVASTDADGEVTYKYTLQYRTLEKLVEGTKPSQVFQADKTMDSYVGSWDVEFAKAGSTNTFGTITIAKASTETADYLAVSGLSMMADFGVDYDDTVYMDFDPKTGYFFFEPQYSSNYDNKKVLVVPYNSQTSRPTTSATFVGGIVENGNIKLYNGYDNLGLFDAIQYVYSNGSGLTGWYNFLEWEPAATTSSVLKAKSSFNLTPFKSAMEVPVNRLDRKMEIKAQPVSDTERTTAKKSLYKNLINGSSKLDVVK